MNNRVSGVLVVHAAPRALSSHIEWAMNSLIGVPLKFRWREQGLGRDLVRVQVFIEAPSGFGAAITSALSGWHDIRFEVTEDPGLGGVGMRFSYTPELGVYASPIDESGATLLTENRISSILQDAGSDVSVIRTSFDAALGGPWDRALEPYRAAIFDDGIRLLHSAG